MTLPNGERPPISRWNCGISANGFWAISSISGTSRRISASRSGVQTPTTMRTIDSVVIRRIGDCSGKGCSIGQPAISRAVISSIRPA